MAYSKTNWISKETLISADAMNKIEEGIESAHIKSDANEKNLKDHSHDNYVKINNGFSSMPALSDIDLLDFLKELPAGKSVNVCAKESVTNTPKNGKVYMIQVFSQEENGNKHLVAQEYSDDNSTGEQYIADLWSSSISTISWKKVLTNHTETASIEYVEEYRKHHLAGENYIEKDSNNMVIMNFSVQDGPYKTQFPLYEEICIGTLPDGYDAKCYISYNISCYDSGDDIILNGQSQHGFPLDASIEIRDNKIFLTTLIECCAVYATIFYKADK